MAETLPNNVDAEKSLLSCLLTSPKDFCSICISAKLSVSDFYSRTNGIIYNAIMNLYNNNRLIDIITVGDELSKAGVIDEIGGIDYLYEISIFAISTHGFIEYLKLVREKSALRRIVSMTNAAKIKAMSQGNSEEILAGLRLDFYKFLNNDVIDSGGCSLDEAYDSLLEHLESGGLEPICRTGFKTIDDYVSGFTETAVWVIGARSSQGKSTFAHNLLMNAVNQGIKVCLFSIEMSRDEIVQKVTSMIAGIPSQAYKGKATTELVDRLKDSQEQAKRMLKNFIVFDKINRYEHICNEIYAQAGQGVKIFCVDHIILINNDKKSGSSARDIGDVVNGFKQIAQELGVCIILISQFNRDQDKRIDQDPRMSDFNGSSDIENIANVAIGIVRPEFYDKYCEPQDKGILKVYILKNRGGMVPQGELRLGCDMALSQVRDLPQTTGFIAPNQVQGEHIENVSQGVNWEEFEVEIGD